MAQKDSVFSLGKIFEERARQIDAERRSANEESLPVARVENEPIRRRVIEAGGRPAYIVEMQGNTLLRRLEADSPEGIDILKQFPTIGVVSVPSAEPAPPEAETEVTRALSNTREVAAVSGRVDPNDLVPKELVDEVREAVLSSLSSQCTIETHQNAVHWLLTKPARTVSLRRLVESNRLNYLLNGPLPPTDPFGEVLRLLLRHGSDLKLEFLDSEQLLNLIAAMEATSDSGLPQPDVNEVRRRLGRREFLSEYDVLLARGFVGRKDEMAELYEFLSAGDQASHPASWTSLVLTGFGGSGKSTLLAKFAREVAKQNLATVVILDFDRPGIDARDFYWMEQEISRQVGHQYPGSSEYLRSRRSEERRHRGEYRDSVRQAASDVEEESRSSRSIMFDVANALTNEGANGRPLLLILDTYEQIEEQDLSVKVFDWLYEISSYLTNTPLRVVFSGRLYDNNLQLLQQQSQSTVVDVGELDPDDAKELLLQNGISEPTAKRLVQAGVLPLRPLELTLLARITIDLDKTIDELEDEINKGGEAAKELFAGLVYRRVLRRLQDPIAQRLAYPGLVLRYVTADLIRYVLGPALDMPAFDEVGAKNAFEALASASWLVRRDGDRVWHRGDLRRSTLKAMMAAERDNAKRISDEAIKYFEEQTDVPSQAEAVYHRLLWMGDPEEGNEFQLAELKRASDHIKANVGDLPPAAATLLKFAVEGKVPSIELECLPKQYVERGYGAAGKDLVQQRLFGKALKLLDRQRAGNPLPDASDLSDWEVDTLFCTVSWDRLHFSEPKFEKRFGEDYIKSISRTFYPRQLIAPDSLRNYPLETLFFAGVDESLYAALRGSDGQETLRRLIISMIYAVGQGEIGEALMTWVQGISRYRRNQNQQPLVPVTERRLVLLERAIPIESSSELPLSINTMRLNAAWIYRFREYLTRNRDEARDANTLLGLLSDLTAVLAVRPQVENDTIRHVLATIDSISKDEGVKRGATLTIHPNNTSPAEAWDYLRGPSPEFRDPCRFALLDAFPDRASLRKLGAIIAAITELDTPDLKPDAFAEIITANPEHALAPYVEFVDRAWALGELMKQAYLETQSTKLKAVSTAFTRWEEALAATINRGLAPSFNRISQSN